VLAAADSRKVKIEDTSTIVDARKAVAGAIIGKERADSLDAAGLDAVILAGATVPRADSWADAFRPAPVSAPADRADAADPLAALLEA
jgi:thymidine phosphorylase